MPNSNDEEAQANEEEINPPSSNQAKRRRRLKQKFLRPQPKKSRRRKSNSDALQAEIIPERWNGVIKKLRHGRSTPERARVHMCTLC